MYTKLSPEGRVEFRKSRYVVYRPFENSSINSKDIYFNILVGGNSSTIDEKRVIFAGIYSEQDKVLIIKNLVSPIRAKLEEDLEFFAVFCEMVLEEFKNLAKARSFKSLIVHTSDEMFLETLFLADFRIVKTDNNFYKAYKQL